MAKLVIWKKRWERVILTTFGAHISRKTPQDLLMLKRAGPFTEWVALEMAEPERLNNYKCGGVFQKVRAPNAVNGTPSKFPLARQGPKRGKPTEAP